jgi:histidyl-tRNA synthetase
LHSNPLRILDTKNPAMQAIVEAAPQLMDFLGEASLAHLNAVRAVLDAVGVAYRINPRLVRGMDYYNLTVFEWITDKLGSQGTVCGGGRYDGLFEQFGGKPTPAVGWGMGVERMLLLLEAVGVLPPGELHPTPTPSCRRRRRCPPRWPPARPCAPRRQGADARRHGGGHGQHEIPVQEGRRQRRALCADFWRGRTRPGLRCRQTLRGEKDQAQQAQALQPLADVAAWAHTLRG